MKVTVIQLWARHLTHLSPSGAAQWPIRGPTEELPHVDVLYIPQWVWMMGKRQDCVDMCVSSLIGSDTGSSEEVTEWRREIEEGPSCNHTSGERRGERALQSSSNMSHPLPLFLWIPPLPLSLSVSVSFPPTLCEIIVTIVTQQIGLEVTVVVGAMATHICLCFAPLLPSTCVGCTHVHTYRPHIVACNNSLLSKD